MLTKANKTQLKGLLDEELVNAEQNINELKKLLEPISPDNAIGRISRMDAIEMQSVNSTKLRNQHQRIEKIRQALVRIDDEGFGQCLECDQTIVIDRLRLRPESRYCVSCQQQLDQR